MANTKNIFTLYPYTP